MVHYNSIAKCWNYSFYFITDVIHVTKFYPKFKIQNFLFASSLFKTSEKWRIAKFLCQKCGEYDSINEKLTPQKRIYAYASICQHMLHLYTLFYRLIFWSWFWNSTRYRFKPCHIFLRWFLKKNWAAEHNIKSCFLCSCHLPMVL